MKAIQKTNVVSFSVKGQVVIPRRLRREFHIEDGTRAMVYAEADYIVVKPITPQFIRNLRGSLKGSKAMDILMEERCREKEL